MFAPCDSQRASPRRIDGRRYGIASFASCLSGRAAGATNPQRGAPPLLIPEAKYFTFSVRFMPADLEAAVKAMACHRSQFTPEMLQRVRPAMERAWNGQVAFIPAALATKGDDLFR